MRRNPNKERMDRREMFLQNLALLLGLSVRTNPLEYLRPEHIENLLLLANDRSRLE